MQPFSRGAMSDSPSPLQKMVFFLLIIWLL
jgi:hypothetical protein